MQPRSSLTPQSHLFRLRRGVAAVGAAILLISATLTGTAAFADTPAPGPSSSAPAPEPYRPALTYSPAQNWMNDPNGLIYYQGKYHMFYQYNKFGTTGGNASWGHAVSTDLIHWSELPVAIPVDDTEEVWSGSIVYDKTNSSGLGTATAGPLVAVYTSAVRATGVQRQSLAYSLDAGTTWTKYAGNPVIDIGSHNFRDPKVFWYAPTNSWRLVAVLSDQHKAAIYSSPDLKNWTEQSEFGPAGVTSAVWECPDLFPLALDGDANNTKWVMVVNVAGKAEYFVGSFDGSTFTDESVSYTPPTGTVLQDFEAQNYADWTTTGTAFGTGPVKNDGVTGAIGSGVVDTYHGGDNETGSLTSPEFTIDKGYLNFLIAGGNHPHVEGGSTAAPAGTVFQDFEGDSLPGWSGTGDFVGITPSRETLGGQLGAGVLDTCQAGCDAAKGTLTSPEFTISTNYIDMLTAGGQHPNGQPNPTSVNLIVDGNVVASVTGNNTGSMDWTSMDASAYQGRTATLQVVDDSDGSTGWGHMMVDNIVFSNAKANPWDAQTGVNLLVDGQVARTATGNDSSTLDWATWNVQDLVGKKAQLQLVDRNTGGWGHLVADQFTLADAPALSTMQQARFVDHGADFYAAVTYNDAPDGKRIMVGWMNNWNYANDTPTTAFRGTQSLPRELSLKSIDGTPTLVNTVVAQAASLEETSKAYSLGATSIPAGSTALPAAAQGEILKIDAVLEPGSATRFGLVVRQGAQQGTPITYSVATGQLSIDRTASGDVTFNPAFPSVDSAPIALQNGKLRLQVYVDRSSVQAFAQDGQLSLTDQIFPDPASTSVSLTATGGTATVDSLTVTPLAPAMYAAAPTVTVGSATVAAGGKQTVSGAGYPQRSSVEVTLTPGGIAPVTVQADDTGSFSVPVSIPAATASGSLTATATAGSGQTATSAPFTVTADPVLATALTALGSARTVQPLGGLGALQASVVNADGRGVPGITVTFTIAGPGIFSSGAKKATTKTDASGVATAPAAMATLTPGTVNVIAASAGLTTVTLPTVTVQKPTSAISTTVTTTTSSSAGKVVVTVTATNTGSAPVSMVLKTSFGAKVFSKVAAGQTVSADFKTNAASVAAGTTTVLVTAGTGSKLISDTYSAYRAK